jgi:1,2-diacylglycerol 3-beta-galactosyltransferase
MRIAQAIAAELTRQRPDAAVEIVDIYSAAMLARPMAWATNQYDPFVAFTRPGYHAVYHLSNVPARMRLLRRLGRRLTRRAALRQLCAPRPPDAIVRLISDLGQLSALHARLPQLPPVIAVITDPLSIHQAWVTGLEDHFLVATAEAISSLRHMGVGAERVTRVGFPIRSHLFCADGSEAGPGTPRPDELLRVLLMGGSSGAGRMLADAQALLAARLPLALTAVCGKNERLARRMRRLRDEDHGPARLSVLGYTDDVPRLMRGADLIITKAGPGTVFEAVACQLPVIINGHLPGQEEGNSDLFARLGVACVSDDPAETVRLVRGFLADPDRLAALRNPALARETCVATGRVARHILERATGK